MSSKRFIWNLDPLGVTPEYFYGGVAPGNMCLLHVGVSTEYDGVAPVFESLLHASVTPEYDGVAPVFVCLLHVTRL